jgi:transcriptional regulator with XRE-family HTH domain
MYNLNYRMLLKMMEINLGAMCGCVSQLTGVLRRKTRIEDRRIRMAGFGDLLRRLRGGRTQKEVASELGMPVTTLSTLENQETIPRGAVLKRLADFYSVSLSYFYIAPSAEMKASDGAKAWLQQLKGSHAKENIIATFASPDFPDDLKRKIAETIKQKKNG